MFTYRKYTRTDHERYLEDELARHQEADERRQREEDERREERRRDFRERLWEAEHSADSWPEALRKQIHLCNREVANCAEELHGEPDEMVAGINSFFANSAKAAHDALELWHTVEAGKQAEIEALEAALESLRDSIRLEVADKLDAHGGSEWASTAAALRESSPSEFINW